MVKIGNKEINPTKIICVGTNYMDHIEETKLPIPKEPVLFPKTLNCLIADGEPIIYPKMLFSNRRLNRVDYEVELAFIINQKCKNVPASQAYEYILGYTIFNDVTARLMQAKDIAAKLPWFRSKSFDTFGPIGPRIVSHKEIGDPHDLKIELKLNDKIKQSSNTKLMLFKVPKLMEYITKFFKMEPNDIVATGTPGGIGPVKPGDLIETYIEKIGTLTNEVILEEN